MRATSPRILASIVGEAAILPPTVHVNKVDSLERAGRRVNRMFLFTGPGVVVRPMEMLPGRSDQEQFLSVNEGGQGSSPLVTTP